jgi:hypothetical protein
MSDPYKVLELHAAATLEDIKKAYRKLALRYHPDKNPQDVEKAHKEMVKINAAYEQLTQQLSGSPATSSASTRTPGRPRWHDKMRMAWRKTEKGLATCNQSAASTTRP